MREKVVEKQLIDEVKKRGGICEKWISGSSGWPDRIVILPDGKFAFVEVKAPGKKPRALQVYRHRQLEKLKMRVYVLDSTSKIGEILDEIQSNV